MLPVELDSPKELKTTPFIFSISSIHLIIEKSFLLSSLAQGFSLLGYRSLIIDLDFNSPHIIQTLESSDFDTDNFLTSNQFLINDQEILPDDFLTKNSIQVDKGKLPVFYKSRYY